MSKSKVVYDKEVLGNMSIEAVAENNRKMRAKANPEVGNLMDQVQEAVDAESRSLEAQFEGDNKLRAWAKELLGFEVSMTQIEELNREIRANKSGKAFIFAGILLIKTPFNTVDRLDRYLFALEQTVVTLTSKPVEKYTKPTFFGLIKLAFKQLLKRSK